MYTETIYYTNNIVIKHAQMFLHYGIAHTQTKVYTTNKIY